MKTYHKNPRQITRQQYDDLEAWMKEFGDLGGIVHDLNSDEVPAGNQRSRVMGIVEGAKLTGKGEVVITERFDEPTPQGTVAWGHIEWEGERFSYRQVRWTERQCEAVSVIANHAGGTDDYDMLANEYNLDDLLTWGLSESKLLGVGWAIEDYTDLDEELAALNGYQEKDISIVVPEMYREQVVDWLANGESRTAPGLGKGVMKRCGLL